jgi:transposase
MTEILVSDDLWAAIQPLLPSRPPSPKGGRPRVLDRAVLGGLVYVLRTGVPWRFLLRGVPEVNGGGDQRV